MYHFFVEPHQIGAEEIRIEGADVNHIRNVLRMKPGEEILISSREGGDYFCRVEELEPEYVSAKILEEWENKELPARIHLFQGLPKGDKMELIIQKAVELGVSRIVPLAMEHSVVRYDGEKAAKKCQRWQKIAESAAKQSKRDIIPQIAEVSAIDKLMAECDCTTKIIAYECEDRQGLKQVLQSNLNTDSILIIIGPEGGISDAEIESFTNAGAEACVLGSNILRASTAGPVALSLLARALGRFI